MKHGALYALLTQGEAPAPRTLDPVGRKLREKAQHEAGQLSDPYGWTGGDAWLRRLRHARSEFDLEQELRDAERFGGWLSRKTRERGARAARVRLAELRGEVLGEGEV